jgi:hypothetical protein
VVGVAGWRRWWSWWWWKGAGSRSSSRGSRCRHGGANDEAVGALAEHALHLEARRHLVHAELVVLLILLLLPPFEAALAVRVVRAARLVVDLDRDPARPIGGDVHFLDLLA